MDEYLSRLLEKAGLLPVQRQLPRRIGIFIVYVIAAQIVRHQVESARELRPPDVEHNLAASAPEQQVAPAFQPFPQSKICQPGGAAELRQPHPGIVNLQAT